MSWTASAERTGVHITLNKSIPLNSQDNNFSIKAKDKVRMVTKLLFPPVEMSLQVEQMHVGLKI